MAIGKDTALRLILIDDQANEAEAMVSSLRNAGIAVRPLRPETLEALAQTLSQQPVDRCWPSTPPPSCRSTKWRWW